MPLTPRVVSDTVRNPLEEGEYPRRHTAIRHCTVYSAINPPDRG